MRTLASATVPKLPSPRSSLRISNLSSRAKAGWARRVAVLPYPASWCIAMARRAASVDATSRVLLGSALGARTTSSTEARGRAIASKALLSADHSAQLDDPRSCRARCWEGDLEAASTRSRPDNRGRVAVKRTSWRVGSERRKKSDEGEDEARDGWVRTATTDVRDQYHPTRDTLFSPRTKGSLLPVPMDRRACSSLRQSLIGDGITVQAGGNRSKEWVENAPPRLHEMPACRRGRKRCSRG